jgi:hypothetical protein
MEIDSEGNLILSCPNFADMTMPSCVLKIGRDKSVRKWFDVPVNPETGEARSMGIAFGPDGDLYIGTTPWTGRPDLAFSGESCGCAWMGTGSSKPRSWPIAWSIPTASASRRDLYVTSPRFRKFPARAGSS